MPALTGQRVIQWHEIFAVIDDGTLSVAEYERLEKAVKEQARVCPHGVACVVILPPGATPPPDPVRRWVNGMLDRLEPSMCGLAYVVEGSGFRAAAVRATLVGMRIFSRRAFPVFVETSIAGALARIGPVLDKGSDRRADLGTAVKAISAARAA